jgi:5-formaminoimidazole-4-carboxamide-1-beta-D-ribofuranosyl 5'-monophosphate synthetase
MGKPEKIKIDEVEYVRADSLKNNQPADKLDGMEYVLVRTYSAGVFVGYLKRRDGKEVELLRARRIWYWEGAASLSQLAQSGTSKPEKCKFPEPVDKIILTEAIEIITITQAAKIKIDEVDAWMQ